MRIIIKKIRESYQPQKFDEGDLVRRGTSWPYGNEDWDGNGNPTTGMVIKVGRRETSRYFILVEWINTRKSWWYDPDSLEMVSKKM